MKEQERLRNRQLELENMRNKHSKSQFDQHHPANGNLKKNELDDFYDDETNTNDEQSDDIFKLIDKIEQDEDVQKVYHNMK